jgi:hypothetical protein
MMEAICFSECRFLPEPDCITSLKMAFFIASILPRKLDQALISIEEMFG